MSKEMIVSVNGREKKIAILENGRVSEFYIERGEENSGVAGNVYKGRVMRVLPGMQSAFVDIGLERDAFLYVSDFFDEEEEIERIVMEKGKKGSPEDAKREAQDQVERRRLEREKQMDGAQEIAEPIAESGVALDVEPALVEGAETRQEEPAREERGRRGRGRGRKDRDEENREAAATGDAPAARPERQQRPSGDEERDQRPRPSRSARREELTSVVEAPVFEIDTSGFERIGDDEDTGEMFKDAYMQEAIVDRVRAAEFDMETTAEAPVGSLLGEVANADSGFERIADEDEEAAAPAKKGKGRAKAEPKPKGEKKAAPKKPSSRSRKKATDEDSADGAPLADAQASVSDTGDISEMAVRRGGRGRRRGGKAKGKSEDGTNGDEHLSESPDGPDEPGDGEQVEREVEQEREQPQEQLAEAPTEQPQESAPQQESENRGGDRGRGRGGRERGGRDRNDRNDRQGSSGGSRDNRRERPPQPTISDLLREGQEILVQIAKEPIAKKGARITSHIALPGRYLVYMPTIEHLGVSRKIESSNERSRLRQMLQRIREDKNIPSGGFIVRTAGIGIAEEDLRNDAVFLARSWADAKKGSEKKKAPAMVHQDLDLVQRLLRDQLSDEFTAIRVDSEEEYLQTVEFMNRMAPKMVNRVKLYTRDEPILDYYGVQEEIEKALKPRVWLKSGGYLVINQTEALVAIDVNTGKFVG